MGSFCCWLVDEDMYLRTSISGEIIDLRGNSCSMLLCHPKGHGQRLHGALTSFKWPSVLFFSFGSPVWMVVGGEPPGAVPPRHLLVLQLQLHPPPAAVSPVLVEPVPRLQSVIYPDLSLYLQ